MKPKQIWCFRAQSPYLCAMSLKDYEINPWVLMLAFAILTGPFSLSFHMHYPDEMYYTDAAVKMLQNGDYLTTYLGSGELRFKKPILSYWTVLAGFRIFGVNPLASRFFFLLAGAITVGLTFWIGRIIFSDKKIAGLSALIMASHPILIFSATRSIPDVLLAMTMTASGVGFAGLIKYGNGAPKKYLWWLYISLGLAFEVKGLPALALGGIGIAYLLFNPWQRISFKTIFHFPSLLTGACIGLFWFVAMYQIHGAIYLASFFEDQVGTRVGSQVLLIIQNGLTATFLLIVLFIPWFFFGWKKLPQSIASMRKENPTFFGFIVLWIFGIILMSAFTSKFYERYLLPITPLAAVGLAWLFQKANLESRTKGLNLALGILLFLQLIVLVFGIYLNLSLPKSPWIWVQVLIGILILFYLSKLFLQKEKLPKAIAYSMMNLFFLISISTYQISLPDQGQQVKAFANANQLSAEGKIGFIGNLHTSSKIRIGLGATYTFVDLPRFNFRNVIDEYDRLILEDNYLDSIDHSRFRKQVVATNWSSRDIPELLITIGSPKFDSLLQHNGKKYYLLEAK